MRDIFDRLFGSSAPPMTSAERQKVLEKRAVGVEKLADDAEKLLTDRKTEAVLQKRIDAAEGRRLKALGEVRELGGNRSRFSKQSLLWMGAFGLLVIFITLVSRC